jgi:hypothetical protein
MLPKRRVASKHFAFLHDVEAAPGSGGNSTLNYGFWRRWEQRPQFLASKLSSCSIEQDLQNRWEAMEQRVMERASVLEDDLSSLSNKVEETVREMEETVEYHAMQARSYLQDKTRSFQDDFAREVLKQRRGWRRWYRSFHNHLGFMVGALVTFAGGVGLASTKRDVIYLMGVATWTILNVINNGALKDANIVEEATDSAKDIVQSTFHGFIQRLERFGRALRALTGSYFFKDVISLVICAFVSSNKLPTQYQGVLETSLPFISLSFHVTRTVRKIVKILRKQDKRKERHKRKIRKAISWKPFRFITKDKQGEGKQQHDHQTTIYSVASFIMVASGVAIVTLLPGMTLNMVAASVSGSHLMFDCLSDEVVGNWLSMLRHMGHDKRRDLFRKASHEVYKKLREHLLYPAEAALEEIEDTLSGKETTHDMHAAAHEHLVLHERIHAAVEKNLDLKLTWLGALYGVLAQVVWINSDSLRQMLLGAFHGVIRVCRLDGKIKSNGGHWRKKAR